MEILRTKYFATAATAATGAVKKGTAAAKKGAAKGKSARAKKLAREKERRQAAAEEMFEDWKAIELKDLENKKTEWQKEEIKKRDEAKKQGIYTGLGIAGGIDTLGLGAYALANRNRNND